jgi:hypothetical protein
MKKLITSLAALLGLATAVPAPADNSSEQAVIVHFTYGSKDLKRIFDLETKLEEAIARAKAGEYDGNEVAEDGSDGYLYTYGPDADRLFDVIRPILESTSFMRGAEVKKRYGSTKSGEHESVVKLAL